MNETDKKENEQMHTDDCVKTHTLTKFAELVGVSPRTIYRWKKKGLPVSSNTGRILCKEARRWVSESGGI